MLVLNEGCEAGLRISYDATTHFKLEVLVLYYRVSPEQTILALSLTRSRTRQQLQPSFTSNPAESSQPSTTVFCRRDLHIDNKSYPCTHPQSNISFNAQEAL
jgi:hypothetical protein